MNKLLNKKEKQRHCFADKWYESWTINKAEHWRIDAFELWCWRRLNPKGNQFWIFTGRTDVEAETPIFWLPDAKNWFIGKDPDTGQDWRQEEKWTGEDEVVGWHHWFDGYEFEQASWVGDGREAWHVAVHGASKNQTMTERLNWLIDLRNWQVGVLKKDVVFLTDIYGV